METGKRKADIFERFVICAIILILAYVFVKYALGVFIPFIAAYFVSLIIYPLSSRITKRTKIPSKVVCAALVILIISLLGVFLYFGISRIIGEAGELLLRFEEADESLLTPIKGVFEKIRGFFSRFSLFESVGKGLGIEDLGSKVSESILEALYSLISKISLSAASLVGKLPEIFIGFFVSIMAAYYFVAEREVIEKYLSQLIPKGVGRIFSSFKIALKKYAKAYLLLMLLTFAESFVGLLLLGVNYSFLIALLIAAVDILPFLGVGAVLLPWALASFLMGNYSLSTGLLILFGVMTVIRQISEPKIIGSSIGLHPFASLFAVYAGFRLFGIWGIIIGPAAALIIKEFIGERAEPCLKAI